MKLKYLIVPAFTLFTLIANGQSQSVTSAAVAHNNSQSEMFRGNMAKAVEELEVGKTEIDKAIAAITPDTKSKVTSKAWYYKALIYMDYMQALMASGDTVKLKEVITEEYGEETQNAVKKALEFDRYKEDLTKYLFGKADTYFNQAGQLYNMGTDEAFLGASQMYLAAGEMKGMTGFVDTNAYLNAAICAEKAKNFELAVPAYQKLAESGYRDGLGYYYLAYAHKQLKNDEEYKKAIEEGLEKFPSKKELIIESVNYNLAQGNKKEALAALEKAIKADPNNKTVYFAAGSTFQDMMESDGTEIDATTKAEFLDKAGSYYDKALELDPNYLDAAYNKGAMYLNAGVDITKEANNLQLGDPKFDELTAKAKSMYEKAIPALEKALELDGTNKGIVRNLKILYGKIGNKEKQLEMSNKLKEMK